MVLKPQDVVIALWLVAHPQEGWTYAGLARGLGMSPSEAHNGAKRLIHAQLLASARSVIRESLREFLIHGVRYAFPPTWGRKIRGIPTAHAAEPLASMIEPSTEDPPVWPYAEGTVRGIGFSPLYPTVPRVAPLDPVLYELLALTDAVRGGRARERQLAIQLVKDRLR